MIRRLFAAAFLAGLALLAPATAASATDAVTPGAYCATADHGAERQAANRHWYTCGQDPHGRYRWLPTGDPSPSASVKPTCTHDGYGKTCTSPAPSRPGYGHPKPSPSTMAQLPVTSSDNGRMLAIALVVGILLVLSGTAAVLWSRTRRKARHHLPRRPVVQRPATGA